MPIPPPIDLNGGWMAGYAGDESGQPVPSLRDFVCTAASGPARLTRSFDVPPMLDVCLRFDLHITAAPAATALSINGYPLGAVGRAMPFILDVTDVITLEDNLITLHVNCPQEGGAFGAVFLKAEPCGK